MGKALGRSLLEASGQLMITAPSSPSPQPPRTSSSWAGRQGAACSPLGLSVVLGRVVGQAVQDEDLAPFGALVQGCQQLVNGLRVQVEEVAAGVRLGNLREGSYCVCYHLERRWKGQRLRALLPGQGAVELMMHVNQRSNSLEKNYPKGRSTETHAKHSPSWRLCKLALE